MSNLGLYKTMTVVAHAVGGPVMLALGIMAIGFVAGKAIEKKYKEIKNAQYTTSSNLYK